MIPRCLLFATGRVFPDEIGGLARLVAVRASSLAALGHDVAVVTRNPGGLPDRERRNGVEIYRFHSPASPLARYHASYLAGARLAARVVRERQVELVDVHHPLLGAALGGDVPRIYNFYASWAREWRQEEQARGGGGVVRQLAAKGFYQYLLAAERRAARRAQKVLVLSEYSARLASQTLRCDRTRTERVPGSVDLAAFRPGAAQRTRFDLPVDAPLLVSVRRLVPRMGLEMLVGALCHLPDAVGLAIVGSGPLEPSLRKQVAQLGLDERVRFLGRVDDSDLPLIYRCADLCVVPTAAYEGFGLVVLESLASGVPVVATRVGALPELLEPLAERLLADSCDSNALARAISAALADPLSAEVCRAHARTYSTDREALALVSVYEQLLG